MNEAAEEAGVVVLHPEQTVAANALRCWNWYALQDRSNKDGDAALIASMTRQIVREHDIDATRVYVAGMSAGGGMAAVLARDLSGSLRCDGCPFGRSRRWPASCSTATRTRRSTCPTGEAIHAASGNTQTHQTQAALPLGLPQAATTPPGAGQRGFTRSVDFGPGGVTSREPWIVHGGGHAWAGGSDEERDTDSSGPDASREVLRFFL